MARNPNSHADTDRWFLQIKGQIIGPIPGAKVLERLVSDEVTVIHRVSQDRRTWAAICNTPYFEELIQYRIRSYTGESQNVGQMKPGGDEDPEFEVNEVLGLHGATDNITEQLDHARQLEELTANIQKLNFLRKEIALKKQTITVEKEADPDAEMHPDDENIFVSAAPKKTKLSDFFKGSEISRKRLSVVLGVVVVGAIVTYGAVWYTDTKKIDEDKVKLRQALEAQAKGDYAAAIASAKGIKGSSLANREFASAKDLIHLADAHIKGRDRKTGQVLLSQAMTMNPSSTDRARAHALQYVLAEESGNLVQASVELEESLKSEELFSTLHNLAILKLKLKNAAEAESLLLKALAMAEKTPTIDTSVTALAAFEAALSLDQADRATALATLKPEDPAPPMKRLEAVEQILQATIKKSTAWRAELSLALAVVHFHRGHIEPFQLAAIELMDSPAELEKQKVETGLDADLAKWTQLSRYCTEIYNRPNPNDFVAAFYSSCLKRSHGAEKALPFAKYALAMRPTDSVYIGITADLLIDLNQLEGAQALLFPNGVAVEGSKLALAVIERLKQKGVGPREPAASLAPPAEPATADPTAAQPVAADQGSAGKNSATADKASP